jgi:hypothetical protein
MGNGGSSFKLAPVSVGNKLQSRFLIAGSAPGRLKESLRIKGCDFLTSIDVGASTPVGQNIVTLPITSAGAFSGTRLERFFKLYEKFCFQMLRFIYIPSVPTSTSGQIMLSYDTDPSDPTPPVGTHGVQQYAGMMGSKSSSVWQENHIDCPLSDTQKFYYTNEAIATVNDERLFAQGQVYVSAVTALSSANTSIGSLWCEWVVDLFDPQLEDDDIESLRSFAAPGAAIPDDSAGTAAGWTNVLGAISGSTAAKWQVFNGTNGILLPAGDWIIEQVINAASAAATISTLTAIDVKTNLTNLTVTAIQGYAAIILGNAFNQQYLRAPTGGTHVWGNVASAAGITATQYTVRVIAAFPEWV